MRKKINFGKYQDEKRKLFIQYDNDDFYIMHQDIDDMNEIAVRYSFEAFVKTFNFMNVFFEELALNNKEVVLKLSKLSRTKNKIEYGYV